MTPSGPIRAALTVAAAVIVAGVYVTAAFGGGAPSQGRPTPQWVGPMDVTKELAATKAQAFKRMLQRAQPATANQTAYDVHYYDLDLHPNPANVVLTGTVLTRASVVAGPLTTMELDFVNGMSVDGATCAGSPAPFTHSSDLVTVTLDRPYLNGETVDVTVSFHGTPAAGGFGNAFSFLTHDSSPLITTLSEPYDARQWWPCKDDPADKADSADIRVTVPTGMITASNGVLLESTDNGTTAFRHWQTHHPIATYLISISSFAYSTSSGFYSPAVGPPMEIQYFIFPESVPFASQTNVKVPAMLAAYASRFGEYPFVDEKYGEAQFTWGGGMENQTCTSLGNFNEFTVAHELAHQWFGDNVTCRDFHHVWLNEGFATYSEALWAESELGAAGYRQSLSSKAYFGPGTIYCDDVSGVGRIFSTDLSYSKPAWVLHMLRHIVGDAAFFNALHAYQQQFAGGTAVTEDLQAVFETVSGQPLGWFFQEWIYGEYYPQYHVSWSSVAAGGGYDVSVQLSQGQSWQIFKMPVDVRIQVTTGANYNFVVQDSLPVQTFVLHVPGIPTQPVLDPDNWILKTLVYPTAVADETPGGSVLELAAPFPNPAPGAIRFSFSTPHAGHVSLAIVDATGRRVADVLQTELPAGPHFAGWDGRRSDGHPAAPGIYWAALDWNGRQVSRKLVVAR
jgi:aminopeptidase N